MPTLTERERLLHLARRRGGLNTRDMAGAGIHRQVLSRLVREGALERVARAQYRLPDALVTEHHGLAVAAAAVPNGIVCLLSAVAFHGVGKPCARRGARAASRWTTWTSTPERPYPEALSLSFC